MKFQALQPSRTRTKLRWLRVRPDEFGIGRLFDRVPDGVVVADVDTGLIVLWNPAAAAMFGYSADEVVGQRIEMLMPPRFRDRHAAGMHHYQATGHGQFIDHGRPMVLPALTKAGTEFTIELTLSPLTHAPTERRYVLAIIRDVTDRARAEVSAERANARLELLALAGMAANEAPSAESAAETIIEAVCRRLGFEVGHLYLLSGTTPPLWPAEVWHLSDEARQRPFKEETERLLFASGEGLPGRVQAGGEVVWLEDLAADASFKRQGAAAAAGLVSGLGVPIRVDSRVAGVLEFYAASPRASDAELSETLGQVGVQLGRAFERQWAAELLEERVKERTASQETAMRELEAFSYSVSHDLRAPLRAIDGFSQIVLEDYAQALPADAQHYLQLIRTASQQMAQLIDDLLRLSRVSRAELRKEPVDMSAIVQDKLSELQRLSPREGLTVEVSDGCTAYGDAQLLPLLVGNLLENAWKFTRKAPRPSIAFGCERQGDQTVYHVRDNGVGFDMAYVDKLFKPFSRLHKTEDFDGTGIGLATVQRVVSRHGGRAWAEGTPEGGATFYFSLPSVPGKAGRRGR